MRYLILLLILIASVSAANYYVDPLNGNDATGTGTIISPWHSPEKAVLAAQPGDTIYLRGGTYGLSNAYPSGTTSWNQPASVTYAMVVIEDTAFPGWVASQDPRAVAYTVNSGTAQSPITIQSYPGERALFINYSVVIQSKAYWRIINVTIDGANIQIDPNYGGATPSSRTHDLYIIGNEISNYADFGGANIGLIKMHGAGGAGGYSAYNIFIWNNSLHDLYSLCTLAGQQNGDCGAGEPIGVNPWNVTTDAQHFGAVTTMSCEIYLQPGQTCQGTGYVEIINNTMYDVPMAFFFKNPDPGPVLIEGNTIYNAQWLGQWTSSNTTFMHNLVFSMRNHQGIGVGYGITSNYQYVLPLDGQNTIIENNTFVDIDNVANFRTNGTNQTIQYNVIFGLAGRMAGVGYNTPGYIARGDAASGGTDDNPNEANSDLKGGFFNNNCLITPYTDFQAVRRSTQGNSVLQHYNSTQAQQLFGMELNSSIIIEPNLNNVFTNPAANDYTLKAGSAAATQCANMGAYASQSIPAITYLSRDAGTTLGGTTLTINGSNFTDQTVVYFGGALATNSTLLSSAQLNVTTPAHSQGVVDVSASNGGASTTLSSGFEYLPSPTTVYANSDFENGTLYPFSGTANVAVSTDVAYADNYSAKSYLANGIAGTGGNGFFTRSSGAYGNFSSITSASDKVYLFDSNNNHLGAFSVTSSDNTTLYFTGDATGATSAYGPPYQTGNPSIRFTMANNPPLNENNGLYQRWYLYVPSATLLNIQGRHLQAKLHLLRITTGSGQPGWLMPGLGTDFNGDQLEIPGDNGIFVMPGWRTTITFGDGVWHEIETWQKRNLSMGYTKVWIDGKKIIDSNDTRLGSNVSTDSYFAQFGIAYTQNGGPVTSYIDDLTLANGYIEPVTQNSTGLSPASLRPGDLNDDGKVDLADFRIILGQFRRRGVAITNTRTDLNNDGEVNVLDFILAAKHWGATYT